MNWYLVCVIVLKLLSYANSTYSDFKSLESASPYYGLLTTASRRDSTGSDCLQKLSKVAKAIENKEVWGLKMLDASGAPRTGVYWGNMYWMGSKKQCYTAHSGKEPILNPNLLPSTKETNESLVPFPVDYYAAYFYHNSTFQMFVHWQNETKITLGLCLPSSCSTEEIRELLQTYFNTGKLLHQQMYSTNLTMDGVLKTELIINWDNGLAKAFYISTFAALLMGVLGTFYDVVFHQPYLKPQSESNGVQTQTERHQNGRRPNGSTGSIARQRIGEAPIKRELNVTQRILIGFSWYTNFKAIFTTKVSKDTLVPISGLRFLLTNFLIFSHSYLFLMDNYDNRTNIFMYSDTLIGQIFQNSSFGVDAFFFLGGFLMVYTLSRSKDLADGEEHTNWSLFKLFVRGIFRRFRRLTPVYMYILVSVYVHADVQSKGSPFWTNERNDLQCSKYWWTNLLYINNIYPGTWDTMCMSWSYYSACDMQFFVITSFVYFLSKKYFKTAVALTFTLLFGSFITLGTVAYMTDYIPYIDQFYQKAPTFYYPPWMRIGPYIVGALYGCFYRKLNGKLDIKKYYVYLLWIASLVIVFYLEFGFIDKKFSTIKAILHASLSRTTFAVSFGWMIFACLTGHGGLLNSLLCAEGWRPFSSLAYTAYLYNPVILFALMNNLETSAQFEDCGCLLIANGLIVVTYGLALFLVLLVEIPVDKMLNIMFGDKPTRFLVPEVQQTSLKLTNGSASSQHHCKAE